MSKRNKLQKFAELLDFPNVYENFDPKHPQLVGSGGIPVSMQGQWAKMHFNNDHPVILELACGRGEYTLALARQNANRNFIGIDIKGARIWKGAKTALQQGISNAAFLRTRIEQIALFFAPQEISELWITFPDPFLKKGKANRRLTSPRFLDEYRKILKREGVVHLKTDSPQLYDFTLEVLSNSPDINLLYKSQDIYAGELPMPELSIQTYYEAMHLEEGRKIRYIRFEYKT